MLALALRGSQFKNNYFTELCRGSEAGSYLRLIDFVYHSTLGVRVIKKKKKKKKKILPAGFPGAWCCCSPCPCGFPGRGRPSLSWGAAERAGASARGQGSKGENGLQEVCRRGRAHARYFLYTGLGRGGTVAGGVPPEGELQEACRRTREAPTSMATPSSVIPGLPERSRDSSE